MQYVTEDGITGYFNCDERLITSKAQEIAGKFFGENTDADTFSILVYDFVQRTHEILEFSIERSITVTGY